MARPPREDVAGAVQHVFARGNRKQAIYRDRADRLSYLAILGAVVRRCLWRPLAYCLMDNHVHLVLETPEANLAQGMQVLHGDYAQLFNERHGETGHVFQGRYGSKRITTDAQLWQTVRYVDRNPVEAQMCETPEAWPWGSRGAVAGGVAPPWLATERWREYADGIFGASPATGGSG